MPIVYGYIRYKKELHYIQIYISSTNIDDIKERIIQHLMCEFYIPKSNIIFQEFENNKCCVSIFQSNEINYNKCNKIDDLFTIYNLHNDIESYYEDNDIILTESKYYFISVIFN